MDHPGGCRWPHNNGFEREGETVVFRVVFVAPAGDEPEIRRRIESALGSGAEWSVLSTGPRELSADEATLAERLARTSPPDPNRSNGGASS